MSKAACWLAIVVSLASCDSGSSSLGPGIPLGGNDGSAPASEVPLAETNPGGPADSEVRLTIISPTGGAVLPVGAAPEIRARVQSVVRGGTTPSADPILPDSVRFFVATDDPMGPAITGLLTGPTFESEYAGRADLSSLPTGRYRVGVVAATRAGAQAAVRTEVLVDAGPRITIVSPRADGAYKGSVAVDLLVEADPFELGTPPEAFVGAATVPLEPGVGPGRFRAVLEFNKSNPPLIDDQLFRVVARNKQGTLAEARVIFFIDDDGPLFTETLPAEGQVVGGVVRIAAKLGDRAGVLGSSVIAFIGNRGGEGFELELHPEGAAGVFSALFDTRKLSSCGRAGAAGLCVLWPSLSFRASDLLGNERVVAYDIGIDNQPPRIDLDPPDMRLKKFIGRWRCSHVFDPVGPFRTIGDMPNDRCGVGQVFDLRARIEDEGNPAAGRKLPPTALVEPASVTAYVLDDTSQSLAVDIDGDGVCDAVNPQLIPTTMPPMMSNEILAVRLAPVKVAGDGDFTPDPSIDVDANLSGVCTQGNDPLPPMPLCFRQDATVAIGYPAATDPEPAIWSIEPHGDNRCIGSQFDAYANQIQEGWACIAVVATDRVGNTSISHPLRVYISHRGTALRSDAAGSPQCGAMAPPANAGPPPDCTGVYDRATNRVGTGTCTGARYGSGEVRPR
jgi:hypothetical protein